MPARTHSIAHDLAFGRRVFELRYSRRPRARPFRVALAASPWNDAADAAPAIAWPRDTEQPTSYVQ